MDYNCAKQAQNANNVYKRPEDAQLQDKILRSEGIGGRRPQQAKCKVGTALPCLLNLYRILPHISVFAGFRYFCL